MVGRNSSGTSRSARLAMGRALIATVVGFALLVVPLTAAGSARATGSAASVTVAKAVPLVTKVTLTQPTCGSSKATITVYTSTDLIIKYRTRTGPLLGSVAEQPAGRHAIRLPSMSRGATASYYVVVQVLDSPQKVYGPYRFHRLSNTNCLVRATQPTRTVANPKALLHLEADASFGYKSRTGAIHWVRSEAPKGWYLITLPAMRWGTSATWYLVVSFTDHSANKLALGPLAYYRGR